MINSCLVGPNGSISAPHARRIKCSPTNCSRLAVHCWPRAGLKGLPSAKIDYSNSFSERHKFPSSRRQPLCNPDWLSSEHRWLPSNRCQLPSNRRRLPSHCRRLPSNRRRLPYPTNERKRADPAVLERKGGKEPTKDRPLEGQPPRQGGQGQRSAQHKGAVANCHEPPAVRCPPEGMLS